MLKDAETQILASKGAGVAAAGELAAVVAALLPVAEGLPNQGLPQQIAAQKAKIEAAFNGLVTLVPLIQKASNDIANSMNGRRR